MKYVFICVMAVLSGLSQGVCGFGLGILLMLALPMYFPMSRAAGIAGCVSLMLTLMMVLRYRKHLNVKKMIVPLIVYAACSALAISLAPSVDQELLKRIFGVFLILLTLYHFLLSKREAKKWSLPLCVAAWAFSGACSGLFSVGGPLMVIYFISNTDSKEEFLGTAELLFFINLILSTFLRIKNGVITAELLPIIALCAVGAACGLLIANRIVDRIDGVKLKNIVYIGVGISGILNLFGA